MTSRNSPHVFSFRGDNDIGVRIKRFAEANGFYKANGEVNWSEATQILVTIALEDYQGQERSVALYKRAKASILSDLKLRLNTVLSDLAKEM